MSRVKCPGFLFIIFLALDATYGGDPLTSEPVLTSSVTLTDQPVGRYLYLKIESLCLLPSNHLLIGALTGAREDFHMRLLSPDDAGQPRHMEVLNDLPGDVKSLALLSNGLVAMTQKPYKNNTVYILEVNAGGGSRVVNTFSSRGRYYYGNLCCAVVAPGPRNNTLVVATFDDEWGDRASNIEVRSITGEVLEVLAYRIGFRVKHMAVFGEDIYITGENLSRRFRQKLLRLNMQTKIFSDVIGSLDLRMLARLSFAQGAFDQQGNFYVDTHNSSGCIDPHRMENTCCSCVMVITREGGTRIIQLSDTGFPDNDYRQVNAVTTTPTGFVAASLAVWRVSSNVRMTMGVIQFYDMV